MGHPAVVVREGKAGSLREWKERKATAEAKADSSASLRNDKSGGKAQHEVRTNDSGLSTDH
jgi:hypothetical protein